MARAGCRRGRATGTRARAKLGASLPLLREQEVVFWLNLSIVKNVIRYVLLTQPFFEENEDQPDYSTPFNDLFLSQMLLVSGA